MYMSTRYRFGWDELQYSTFQAYNMALNIVGKFDQLLIKTTICILYIVNTLMDDERFASF